MIPNGLKMVRGRFVPLLFAGIQKHCVFPLREHTCLLRCSSMVRIRAVKRDAVHPPKYFPIVGPMAGGDGISQGRQHARGV